MARPMKYPPELRARALKLVNQYRSDPATSHGAIARVSRELNISAETLRTWVSRAGVSNDEAPGAIADLRRIAELERENNELRRANDILRAASTFFAAELDRPSKR
jgi:transposase